MYIYQLACSLREEVGEWVNVDVRAFVYIPFSGAYCCAQVSQASVCSLADRRSLYAPPVDGAAIATCRLV